MNSKDILSILSSRKNEFEINSDGNIRTKGGGDMCPLAFICSKLLNRHVSNQAFLIFRNLLNLSSVQSNLLIGAADNCQGKEYSSLRTKMIKALGINNNG